MYETSNISNNGEFSLSIGHHSVVQKGDVGQNYIYALQLRDNQRVLTSYVEVKMVVILTLF